jgi:hypothetical protein
MQSKSSVADTVVDALSSTVDQVKTVGRKQVATARRSFGDYSDDVVNLIVDKTPLLRKRRARKRGRQLVLVFSSIALLILLARWMLSSKRVMSRQRVGAASQASSASDFDYQSGNHPIQ